MIWGDRSCLAQVPELFPGTFQTRKKGPFSSCDEVAPVGSYQLGLLVTSAFPWLFLYLSTPPDALTLTPVDSRTCQG